MMDGDFLSLALVLILLAISAFFASSESAFLSVQRTRLAHLVSEGVPGARRVAEMIGEPERLLVTILLGNNIVNAATTAVITAAVVAFVGGDSEPAGVTPVGVVIATAISTVALVLFGDIIPKTIAVRNSEKVAILYSRPLTWTEYLLLPFVLILQWATRGLNALLGGDFSNRRSITEDEFRSLIDIGEAEGEFEPAEAEMLENVFQFGDRQVREVMTPRNEMITIQQGSTLREFLDMYSLTQHTRFPVYRNSTDNIIGIISSKDVLRRMAQTNLSYDDSVTEAIRDTHFVPETKRISDLFDELRMTGNQIALVIDEFGGVSGLVTLKRLLEVVVGPVGEEGESPEDEFRAIDENTFHVEGGMSIQEANQEMDIELPHGEYETIAGFALDVLGHIPVRGEQFEYENMMFEILRMQDLRIEEVRVTKSESVEVERETDPG